MCALAQVYDQRYRPGRELGGQDVLLLSIGAGTNLKFVTRKTRRWGIFRWGVKFVRLTMDGTVGIADYQCGRLLTPDNYQRVEPHFPAGQFVDIDDLGKIDELKKFANDLEIREDVIAWLRDRWMAAPAGGRPVAVDRQPMPVVAVAAPAGARAVEATAGVDAPDAVRSDRRVRRDKSRDGFVNRLKFFVLTHFASLWRFVQRHPRLERIVNAKLIDMAIEYAPTRPNPLSTRSPYTSWASLTDRTWFGRHLPPCEPHAEPAVDDVVSLFVRRRDGMRASKKSTALFAYFAQWFTDAILRSDFTEYPRHTLKNTSNHEIDLCNLYGVKEAHTELLREHHDGRLRSQMIGGEEYPPFYYARDERGEPYKGHDGRWATPFDGLPAPLERPNNPLPNAQRKHLFAMGGERANITPGYAMMNTLFLREHNRVAGLLKQTYRSWDDERLFQTTRSILIVQLLKIVVEDYINHITPYHFRFRLGAGRQIDKAWYRTNWVALEFNLLYRWHSLTPDTVLMGASRYPMEEVLWNNRVLIEHGLAEAFGGATAQPSGEIGLFNTPRWLAEMADRPSIELGRRAQLATYNDYREWCRFPRVASVDQISSNPAVREALMRVYHHVDAIELYAGLFGEDVRERSALPPLMGRMVGIDAFSQALTNPLISKYVYNERTFSALGLEIIDATASLNDLVRHNVRAASPVTFTQASFTDPSSKGVRMPVPDDSNAQRSIVAAFEAKATARFDAAVAAAGRPKGGGAPAVVMQRGAHPKHHGIVRATFRIEPALEPDLAQGLFGTKGPYSAYVRFSNSSSDPKHDGIPDARGMAIKVMGVEGRKLLDDEPHTQDFVLVSSPVFFTATPQGFFDFLQLRGRLAAAMAAGQPTAAIEAELAQRFGLARLLQKVVRNPLTERYWSQTPYALGGGPAVKYLAEPRILDGGEPLAEAEAMKNGADYLKRAMAQTLAGGGIAFDFKVQRRLPDMPIDDPTVEWDAQRSPFVRVATLEIPAQDFESQAQMTFAENAVFNPWHALEIHRPLGRINEARRDVYVEMVKFRHARNGVVHREPTGHDDFVAHRAATEVKV
jgi:prostaglandin-endoperoxide synthase 2